MFNRSNKVWLFFFGYCYLLVVGAYAQQGDRKEPTNKELLMAGLVELEAERYAEAVETLTSLVNDFPGYYEPAHGSAAYWAGKALTALGRPEQARIVWLLGLKELGKAGQIDARLSDVYIRSVFRERRESEFQFAADVYLHLLEQGSGFTHFEERCIIKQHLAQAQLLLPQLNQAKISESKRSSSCKSWQIAEQAGPYLAGWWRSQDPRLATVRNERLEEHLERIVEVEKKYKHYKRVSGLDDRGEVYIRFGKPSKQIYMGISARTGGVAIAFSDRGIPKSEVWLYEQIDPQGYYIFVQEGRAFKLGQVSDIASNYRGPGGVGKRYSVLQQVYEKLMFVHPDFAARYTEMENYSNQVNVGSHGQSLRSMWYATLAEEGLEIYEREKRMPVFYDGLMANVGQLPVSLRTARLLDKDGTTRTEFYWHADLEMPMQRALSEALSLLGQDETSRTSLQLTVAQQDAQHRSRHVITEQYLQDKNASLIYTSRVKGDTGLYHVALQWDQHHEQGKEGENIDTNKILLRTAMKRANVMQALSSAEDQLEMSDIVPVYAETLMSLYDGSPNIHPFPFSEISRQDSLGLYFEIYHLTYGADDQTHYSVEYEFVQKKPAGGLLRLKKRDIHTAAKISNTGQSRTARDAFLLAIDEWVEGKLEVIVRVTDETSGQQVERSVWFEMKK